MKKKWLMLVGVVVLVSIFAAVAFADNPIKLIVNGREIKPDVAPQIINGRTMVPVRWIAEALGADVQWDDSAKIVKITTTDDNSQKRSSISISETIESGTLAEAEKAVGFRAWHPNYLPAKAIAQEKVYWDTKTGFLTQHYIIGDSLSREHLSFGVSQRHASLADFKKELQQAKENKGFIKDIEINGCPGWLYEEHPEQTDKISKGYTKLCWYQDKYIFSISGELILKEEFFKIATSLKPPANIN